MQACTVIYTPRQIAHPMLIGWVQVRKQSDLQVCSRKGKIIKKLLLIPNGIISTSILSRF